VATDRIVEVSFLKVMPNGEETVYTKKINPKYLFPQNPFFHGIYDEDVKDAPNFKAIAVELAAFRWRSRGL
jgi:DNA polymerase-3 subunit epsilon